VVIFKERKYRNQEEEKRNKDSESDKECNYIKENQKKKNKDKPITSSAKNDVF